VLHGPGLCEGDIGGIPCLATAARTSSVNFPAKPLPAMGLIIKAHISFRFMRHLVHEFNKTEQANPWKYKAVAGANQQKKGKTAGAVIFLQVNI
jgi:hypothetical protein